MNELLGKVGFAVGTGRCGTKFLAKVAALEPQVASSHERNPYNETFHRYVKWYGLPVDHEGFLTEMARGIQNDLQTAQYSFEASAFLSISIEELYERFKPRFVLLTRSSERVVNSFYHKGWYQTPFARRDSTLAPSYQECESFHHVLARFAPSGEKFEQWNAMTRVGKLAWFWNAMNARVLEQFERIPAAHWRVEKLEELDFHRYQDLAQFLGYTSAIQQEQYDEMVMKKPNSFSRLRTIADWSEEEIGEFEQEVAPMAQTLGYPHRVADLPVPVDISQPVSQPLPFIARLRKALMQ
jgi:hypothetical protein